MKKINQFTEEEIKALKDQFYYNPETGELFRKLKSRLKQTGWPNGKGYAKTRFRKKIYFVHRIAWAIYYGTNPKEQIDHKNGDGTDNRILNLREATNQQNSFNTKCLITSKSGIKGVHWYKKIKRWQAQIRINGKKQHLGSFTSKEEAVLAYQAKAKELHGEFYRP